MKASVAFLFIAVITSSTAAPLLFISTLKNCLNEILQEKTTTAANRIDTFTPLPQLETPDENIEFTSTVLRKVEELFEEKEFKAFTTIAPLDLGVEAADLPSVIFREVNERLVKKEIAAPITTSTTTTTTTTAPIEIEPETEEPAKTTDEKKYTIPELIASKVKERVVSSSITKAVVNNKVSKGLIYLTPMFLQKTLYLDRLISEVNRIDSSPITTSPIEMEAETEAAEPALEKEYTIPELIAMEVKDRVVSSKITKAVVNNKVSKGLIYLTPTFFQKRLYLDKLVTEVNKN